VESIYIVFQENSSKVLLDTSPTLIIDFRTTNSIALLSSTETA